MDLVHFDAVAAGGEGSIGIVREVGSLSNTACSGRTHLWWCTVSLLGYRRSHVFDV